MKIALCLLTMNEVEGCRLDLPRIPREAFDEIFAVDGDSRDGTREILREHGIPVVDQLHRGYNGAYLAAFRHLKADAVVFFHPKGTTDPEECRRFRALFEAGHELVIASRMTPGAVNEEDNRIWRPRKWFVLGLSLFAAIRWRREGSRVMDVLHGFRGITKRAFDAMGLPTVGSTADLAMVIHAYRSRLRRIEFATIEKSRASGVTHFPAFPTGFELIRFLLQEASHRS